MVHQRRRFGNWGEDAAVRYLKTRGYEILDRNYRSSWGEIDIIARQRDVLAFVCGSEDPAQPEIRPSGCGRNPGKTDPSPENRLVLPSGKPGVPVSEPVRYHRDPGSVRENFSESFEELFLKVNSVGGQLSTVNCRRKPAQLALNIVKTT